MDEFAGLLYEVQLFLDETTLNKAQGSIVAVLEMLIVLAAHEDQDVVGNIASLGLVATEEVRDSLASIALLYRLQHARLSPGVVLATAPRVAHRNVDLIHVCLFIGRFASCFGD